MRILHVSIADGGGGAARAAYRLHVALRDAGMDSHMLVGTKQTDDPSVHVERGPVAKALALVRPRLDVLPVRLYRGRQRGSYSVGLLGGRLEDAVQELRPSIVNLHWIGSGYMGIRSIGRLRVPIVWTLHDAWPFTGGCHYPSPGCSGFVTGCGRCPHLGSTQTMDLSRVVVRAKARAWRKCALVAVCPSRWLAAEAQRSELFRHRHVNVIPNGIDTEVFRPLQARAARQALGLPEDRRYLLFVAAGGAANPIKGFSLLREATSALAAAGALEGVELLVVGASRFSPVSDCGLPVRYLGRLSDETSVALANCAADVIVVPSVQENLANTVLEAMACGRPVVAFSVGGMPDMVEDLKTGLLVRPFDVRELGNAIKSLLADPGMCGRLGGAARERAQREFGRGVVAQRYRQLYSDVLRNAATA